MYVCRARDCQGEHGIKGAASSDVKAGNCGEGLLDVVLSPPPSLAYLGRKTKGGGGSANQVGGSEHMVGTGSQYLVVGRGQLI